MTVLEKIKRCVSLVWDFQEFYGDEDIEDFCSNELDKYSQYNEILDYFKRITELEQKNKVLAQNLEDTEIINNTLEEENAELKKTVTKMNNVITETFSNLTKAKELLERLLITSCNSDVLNLLPNCSEVLRVRVEAEQFLSEVEK